MTSPSPPPKHETAPPVEQGSADELLDESLHETFPASDPVSSSAAERSEVDEADRARRERGETEVVDANPDTPPPPPDEPLFPTSDKPPV